MIGCSQNNTSSRGGDDLGDGGHPILAYIILGQIEFIVMALICFQIPKLFMITGFVLPDRFDDHPPEFVVFDEIVDCQILIFITLGGIYSMS